MKTITLNQAISGINRRYPQLKIHSIYEYQDHYLFVLSPEIANNCVHLINKYTGRYTFKSFFDLNPDFQKEISL